MVATILPPAGQPAQAPTGPAKQQATNLAAATTTAAMAAKTQTARAVVAPGKADRSKATRRTTETPQAVDENAAVETSRGQQHALDLEV